jgi:hypothetical protein
MEKVGFSTPNFAIIKKKAHATLKDIRLFMEVEPLQSEMG